MTDEKKDTGWKAKPDVPKNDVINGIIGLVVLILIASLLFKGCCSFFKSSPSSEPPTHSSLITDEKTLQVIQNFITTNNYGCYEIFSAREMDWKHGYDVICYRNSNHGGFYSYEIIDRGGRTEIVVK